MKVHLLLNPGYSYTIKPEDLCFFIASSAEDVNDFYELNTNEISIVEQSFNEDLVNLSLPSVKINLDEKHYVNFDSAKDYPDAESKTIYIDIPPPPFLGARTHYCYMTKIRKTLSESVYERVDNFMKKHILVLVECYSDLFRFIATIRSANLPAGISKEIVLFNSFLPKEEEWNKLNLFPDIYIVIGDYRIEMDLERAGLNQAEKIIILSRSKSIQQQSDDVDNFCDGGTM